MYAKPESIRKLHVSVISKSPKCFRSSASPPADASGCMGWVVPYDWLMEEEKGHVFHRWVGMVCAIASLLPHSGMALETCGRENPLSGNALGIVTGHSFCVGENETLK